MKKSVGGERKKHAGGDRQWRGVEVVITSADKDASENQTEDKNTRTGRRGWEYLINPPAPPPPKKKKRQNMIHCAHKQTAVLGRRITSSRAQAV